MAARLSPDQQIGRERVVAAARRWIGTPYRHQASRPGVGCDCLGLVAGIWRDLYGRAPAYGRTYSADWAETAGDGEPLLDACARHCQPVAMPRPGDLLAFRFAPRTAAKHLAIMATPGTIIHARERHAVCEEQLTPWWRRRIAGIFSFPPVTDEI